MRTNVITLIVGDRGTGKTTLLKGGASDGGGILDAYRRRPRQKILIADIFNNPAWADVPLMATDCLPGWKSGEYRVFHSSVDELMEAIEQNVYNAAIVFEDATKYIGSKLNADMKRFLIDSKQKNIDVYFVFHSLAACPLDLIRIANFIILFKTKEAMNDRLKGKFPFPEIPAAFERVRAHPSRYHYEAVNLD
jgi:hypothetical protein